MSLNASGAVLGIEGELLLCLLSLPFSISSASPRETSGCIHRDDDRSANERSRFPQVCSTVNPNAWMKTLLEGFFYFMDIKCSLWYLIFLHRCGNWAERENYRQRGKNSLTRVFRPSRVASTTQSHLTQQKTAVEPWELHVICRLLKWGTWSKFLPSWESHKYMTSLRLESWSLVSLPQSFF